MQEIVTVRREKVRRAGSEEVRQAGLNGLMMTRREEVRNQSGKGGRMA
jgi:hypothetical protein